MSYKKVIWGILLIIAGVLILLNNLGILQINWRNVVSLWPLIFVFWGISILPAKDYVKLILAIITLAVGMAMMFGKSNARVFPLGWFSENETEEFLYEENKIQSFSEPFDSTITYSEMKLEAAAGKFRIVAGTDNLFDFSGKGGHYFSLTTNRRDSLFIANFSLNRSENILKRFDSRIDINLNPTVIWNLGIDAGASDIHADLSDAQLNKVSIDGGACTITLKTGILQKQCSISINAGASTITIYIPEASSCEIFNNTVLTDKSFNGFEKVEKGYWKSSGYNPDSESKTRIDINGAVATVNIIRY